MEETTSTFRRSPSRWPMHRSTRAIKVLLDPDVPTSTGALNEGGAFFALGVTSAFLFLSFILSLLCRQPPYESAAEQFEPRPRSKQVSRSFYSQPAKQIRFGHPRQDRSFRDQVTPIPFYLARLFSCRIFIVSSVQVACEVIARDSWERIGRRNGISVTFIDNVWRFVVAWWSKDGWRRPRLARWQSALWTWHPISLDILFKVRVFVWRDDLACMLILGDREFCIEEIGASRTCKDK